MTKWANELNRMEMQFKTTLRFHLTSVKMATIKNTTTNVGQDAGKTETFIQY
jgi:hypothetical protein